MAEERISREIDIVTLLRHQMIDDIARRLLFTRMERYLIRNQAKPFVLEMKYSSKKCSDSDSSDYYPTQLINDDQSPYFFQLLEGAIPKEANISF